MLREAPLEPHQRRQFVTLTEMFRATKRATPEFAVIPIEAEAVAVPRERDG